MKKNVETVSIREFARLCGKNHTWVRRRIKDGTLPVADDGTVPVEDGLDAFKKLVGNLAKTAKEAEKISTDIDPKEIGLEFKKPRRGRSCIFCCTVTRKTGYCQSENRRNGIEGD